MRRGKGPHEDLWSVRFRLFSPKIIISAKYPEMHCLIELKKVSLAENEKFKPKITQMGILSVAGEELKICYLDLDSWILEVGILRFQ